MRGVETARQGSARGSGVGGLPRGLFFLVPLLFVLSACAGLPASGGHPVAASIETPATAATRSAAPRNSSAGQDIDQRKDAGPAKIFTGNAQTLMGLEDAPLAAVLGQPTLVRHDEPAQIWQYSAADCVLDIYLYAEGAKAYRVAYVEARSTRAEILATDSCVQSVARRSALAAQAASPLLPRTDI